MVIHEGAKEVMAVVVAYMAAQSERLIGLFTRGLEGFGVQLVFQEIVSQALVNQDPLREGLGRRRHEFGSVVPGPFVAVFPQIAAERLFTPGTAGRRCDGRKR